MRIPLAHDSQQVKSRPLSDQQLVNLYYEPGPPKSKTGGALYGTPGLKPFTTVGDGPIWGMHVMAGLLYVVSKDNVFTVSSSGGTTDLGTIGTVSDVVIMDNNGTHVAIVKEDGAAYVATASTLAQITDAQFPSVTSVTVLNFYGIFTKKDTSTYIISNLNDMTAYEAADTADAEEKPDLLVRAFAFAGELWLFGEETIEIHDGTDEGDFPFRARRSSSIQRGCLAKRSVAQEDNTIFWLGDDRIIYRANGYSPKRISTHAIEEKLQGYTTLSDAEAFIYTQNGHKFLVMTFPTEKETLVHDIATDLWHQRQSFEKGRWKATSHAFIYDKNLVGDFETNDIYELDLDTYTDDSNEIERIVVLPPVYDDDRYVTYSNFKVDFDSGLGLVSGQGSNPQAMMRYSDDGANTWSNERFRPMGKIGEYKARTIWRRLGRARQRVFEIKVTDPIEVNITAAYVNEPD